MSDAYPCIVDGAPAEIGVNLRFEHAAPSELDIRYTLAIAMREAGEHGLGSAAELAALELIEEALVTRAFALRLVYAGQLRSRGVCEITFYGTRGHLEPLRSRALEHVAGRQLAVLLNPEPGWSYYRELLLPDAERRRWLALCEEAALAVPRLVEHRLTLEDRGRAGFIATARAAGFEVSDDGTRVRRVDPVEAAHLHAVVALLAAAALPGRYEDWAFA